MERPRIDPQLLDRLFSRADAARWGVSRGGFLEALEASATRALGDRAADGAVVSRYLEGLHLGDLALALACQAGHDAAWDHFMREQRPPLYRAADAMDPTGRARQAADALYAELWDRSLFRHFHGRSSLATWLRAVLAQRHVDQVRADRRTVPLPEHADPPASSGRKAADPDRRRWIVLSGRALRAALAALPARDRLRVGCYYAQGMTLAAIGRLLGEHEATVSRHLTRTRQVLKQEMERHLREDAKLGPREVDECLAAAAEDSGTIDLTAELNLQERAAGAFKEK
jgi:RNA polymerase sigma factor (sigma-70 family)